MSVYVLVNISNNKITFIDFACFDDISRKTDRMLMTILSQTYFV